MNLQYREFLETEYIKNLINESTLKIQTKTTLEQIKDIEQHLGGIRAKFQIKRMFSDELCKHLINFIKIKETIDEYNNSITSSTSLIVIDEHIMQELLYAYIYTIDLEKISDIKQNPTKYLKFLNYVKTENNES